jgi:hypothetical protein
MIEDTNTEETVVNEVATEAVGSEEVPASLTVQDLANLRNIIDVASQRGAFKAEEFGAIGDAYSKLNAFIVAITPAPTEAPASAEAPAQAGA